MPFNARDYLSDWVMTAHAALFIVVPLISLRLRSTRHKSTAVSWKLFAIMVSHGWWFLLFASQTLDLPFIEDNAEMRFFIGRIGYLAVGYAECVYVLNGWVFDLFRATHRVLEPVWRRVLRQWKSFLSLRSS